MFDEKKDAGKKEVAEQQAEQQAAKAPEDKPYRGDGDLILGYFAMKTAKADCERRILDALADFSLKTRLHVIDVTFRQRLGEKVGPSDEPKPTGVVMEIGVIACIP